LKRKDLIRQLVDAGCFLKRHGKRHDMYENPTNGRKSPVPRHAEIKETLCELIKKQLGI
jgi:mRNA interferase HicA